MDKNDSFKNTTRSGQKKIVTLKYTVFCRRLIIYKKVWKIVMESRRYCSLEVMEFYDEKRVGTMWKQIN